jgi:hypothetical protein
MHAMISLQCSVECPLGNAAIEGALYVLLPVILDAGNSNECRLQNIFMCVVSVLHVSNVLHSILLASMCSMITFLKYSFKDFYYFML